MGMNEDWGDQIAKARKERKRGTLDRSTEESLARAERLRKKRLARLPREIVKEKPDCV